EIVRLPDSLGNLVNLTSLDVYDNKLLYIPDSFANIKNNDWVYREPNFDRNYLTLEELKKALSDEDAAEQFTTQYERPTNSQAFGIVTEGATVRDFEVNYEGKTTGLDLYFNNLYSIAPEMGNLSELVWLRLESNHLTDLPANMANLQKLERLNLRDNSFLSLPECVTYMSSLERLNIANNYITSLQPSIAVLQNLKHLYASGNELTTLPDSIGSLSALETLSLDNNKLESLPDSIGMLSNLTSLKLNNNNLTALPDDISYLKNNNWTEYPDLNYNYLTLEELKKILPDDEAARQLLTQRSYVGIVDGNTAACDIKNAPDGSFVKLTSSLIVSSDSDDTLISNGTFYASQPNRLGAVRCVMPRMSVTRGQRITFTGTVYSDSEGKYVEIEELTSQHRGEEIQPIGGAADQKNNALVRVWGVITQWNVVIGGSVTEPVYGCVVSYGGKEYKVKVDDAPMPLTGAFLIVNGFSSDAGYIIPRRSAENRLILSTN
ncbi:MAG: leucine-rich repeat domain-containing protein, partial [Abditibacteriota bacterium]|nr:leucine-rich repeat domain-containing protein [Abditibacteriota bacterium]